MVPVLRSVRRYIVTYSLVRLQRVTFRGSVAVGCELLYCCEPTFVKILKDLDFDFKIFRLMRDSSSRRDELTYHTTIQYNSKSTAVPLYVGLKAPACITPIHSRGQEELAQLVSLAVLCMTYDTRSEAIASVRNVKEQRTTANNNPTLLSVVRWQEWQYERPQREGYQSTHRCLFLRGNFCVFSTSSTKSDSYCRASVTAVLASVKRCLRHLLTDRQTTVVVVWYDIVQHAR